MRSIILAITLILLAAAPVLSREIRLEDPVRVKLADGADLDIGNIGHAAPAYADVDGDKVPDLLVGEFSGGACWIYKNHGTAQAPVFKKKQRLMAGSAEAVVPPS